VDIFVLDETGQRVGQERRVSKTNTQVNQRTDLHPGLATPQHPTVTNTTVASDDDEASPSPQLKLRHKRWPKVMNSPDEEDVDEVPNYSVSFLNSPRPNTDRKNPSEALEATDHFKPQTPRPCPNLSPFPKSQFWVEIPRPLSPVRPRGQAQDFTLYDSPPQPPPGKHRQLTPIRRKRLAFPQLTPSPSTVDLDLSIDLADLTLSSPPLEDYTIDDQPPHLAPLLDECGQDAPIEFSAFIEAFPVHHIVRSSFSGRAVFQKIGEASYSEVFGIGDVVLKIIPIRNEECPDKIDAETPAPSDARDILKEIVVTRALGEMCDGFVNLLKTYVVRGKYPSLLLDLWDEYNKVKGSESVRPGATLRVSTYPNLIFLRYVGRVTGVRNNRVAQWWPRFGSILVQPTWQDRLEASL
jgi:serine/threonine-protein kinase haspin